MLKGAIKLASGESAEISRIVLGAGSFGSIIDYDTSFRMMDRYFEMGGNVFDTGRIYVAWIKGGASQSEKTLGAWVRSRGVRDKIHICTKGAHPEMHNMYYNRLHPECIEYDILTSLAVLGMDYIDVYFLHRDDEAVPVSIIMDALHEQVLEGRCRSLGASNWTVRRIREANDYADKNGKTPFTVSQIQWTLADCWRSDLIDKTCLCMEPQEYEGYMELDFPVIAYSSQALGFFPKYIAGGEASLKNERVRVFLNETNIKRAKKVEDVCKKLGCTPTALSVAYITNNPLNGFAIIGNSSMEQLEDSLSAADLIIDSETIEWLTS